MSNSSLALRVVSPTEWVFLTSIHFMWTVLNFIILKSEIKHRRKSTTKSITKGLQYGSLTTIVTGFLAALFCLLNNFPIFCSFGLFIGLCMFAAQSVSLTFYQLCRLYYCFANVNIHSNKGYPKWVFYIMYGLGIVIFLSWTSWCLFNDTAHYFINSKCAFQGNSFPFQMNYYPANISSLSVSSSKWTWKPLTSAMSLIWDIMVLILYIIKIKAIQNHHSLKAGDETFQRIMYILKKITVILVLYQLCGLINVITHIIHVFIASTTTFIITNGTTLLFSVSMSLSMYLMMDHNEKDWKRFANMIPGFDQQCNAMIAITSPAIADPSGNTTNDVTTLTAFKSVDDVGIGDNIKIDLSEQTVTMTQM